jgi:hypothetical protein
MIELYFLLYGIPKMMSRLARERKRSALGWSLIGVGAWIVAEIAVALAVGSVHGIGVLMWGWPEESAAASVLTYVLALGAAVASLSIVARILRGKPTNALPLPPSPPDFHPSEQSHVQ